MRLGVLSDIHGNVSALEVVLRDAHEQGCHSLLWLGDIVGQFEHSKECLDLVRARCVARVKGNHDEYCTRQTPVHGFNTPACAIIERN